MLELDLLLTAFVDREYQCLTADECNQFECLLEYPDQTLYEILVGKIKPADKKLSALVDAINETSLKDLQSG